MSDWSAIFSIQFERTKTRLVKDNKLDTQWKKWSFCTILTLVNMLSVLRHIIFLKEVIPDRSHVVTHIKLHSVISFSLNNIWHSFRSLEAHQFFGSRNVPFGLEERAVSEHSLTMCLFHQWSGEAQRQVGSMVKLLINQLVEVVHHALHDLRTVVNELVLNLRYF